MAALLAIYPVHQGEETDVSLSEITCIVTFILRIQIELRKMWNFKSEPVETPESFNHYHYVTADIEMLNSSPECKPVPQNLIEKTGGQLE